jgi:Mn-dependent DtxR family transcriptional regulator
MDDADILIPVSDHLVAQAELFLSGCIEFDDDGAHITRKGYATARNYLKKLSTAERALISLFYEDIDKFGNR